MDFFCPASFVVFGLVAAYVLKCLAMDRDVPGMDAEHDSAATR
jgi:hypothetical protein